MIDLPVDLAQARIDNDRAGWVDSLEDPLKREMVRVAARRLSECLADVPGVDLARINLEGAAWFVVAALSGPARQAAWRDLLAVHTDPAAPDERFDHDPAALAWARAKVRRNIDKLRRWQATDAANGEEDRSKRWRSMANHLHRTFVGGEGCVIAAFDARLPQVRAEVVVTDVDPALSRPVPSETDGDTR